MDFLDYVSICQKEVENEEQGKEEQLKKKNAGTFAKKAEMQFSERAEAGRLPKECRGRLYKVEKGDTLYSISRKYNLKVRDLMQANPFVNVYQLQPGEELCIPVVPEEEAQEVRPYIVKKEDTVLSILRDHQLSYEELARWNRSAEVLKFPAGTILFLPN